MTKNKLDPKYKKVWGIYKIINLKNNKIYFGSSNNLYKRSLDHFSALRKGKHGNKHLQNAFDKYGENSFEIEVEKTFSKNEITLKNLRDIETEYIQQNKTYLQEYGYNLTSVGSGTSTKDFTEERKRKISKSNKGRVAYNKGIKMSKEQRLLIKNINTKRFGKPILEYDIFGNFIKRYESVTEAAKKYNFTKRDIIDVCKGRRGHLHNKIFRYEGSLDFGEDYFIKKYKKKFKL